MSAGTEERVQRGCSECPGVDDAPRHVRTEVGPDGQPVDRYRHMDCCAARGCPDGTCDQILKDSGHAKGASLVSYLTGGSA